jgi:C4-dicarboxylate-specific signal transduction histidine kinase
VLIAFGVRWHADDNTSMSVGAHACRRLGRQLLALRVAATNAALALVAVSFAAPYTGAQAAENTAPGVLILHSNQRPTPAQVIIDDTLRAVVPQEVKRPVQLYSEYLDAEWTSLQTYGSAQAAFLREKYGPRNISVIVADSLPALRFEVEFRDRMFPRVPIVYLSVAVDRVDRTALPSDVVGIVEDHDPTPTLQLALRLHRDARRLVLVRGAGELDLLWDTRIRRAMERLEGGVQIEYLSGLSTAEVLRRVGTLPPGTIVFTPGYFVDGAGEVSTPRNSTERIAKASAVPVYGTYDTLIGTGIIGGYVSRFEDEAKQAGAIVVRLLNGAAPAEIPPIVATRVPMVDWRQIRRWGVDERLLPADTVVRFREPSAWEKYWREISVGVAILVFQAGLIASLLIEMRSRRRLAMALEESQKRMSLAARAARLSMWIWDVARDKLWTTTHLRQQAGLPEEQAIAYADVLASTHPADREALDRAVRKAVETGEELDVEYRVVRPDGDVRWIVARGRAEKGNGHRLLGIVLDNTERKLAELRAAEDRTALRHMTRVSMLGQLSASIAHQLNQPLAAILGNAEAAQKMLTRERVDLVELREICDDIVAEDNRAAEVIRRLGALYKRGEMKMELLDPNELIRETLDLLRSELLIRDVTPLTDLTPALPVIDGGRVQLQQVLLNLILNACDAMSDTDTAKRKLRIGTESNGANVQLYVVDCGSGIATDDLKNVFDAFWSTKVGGMGIGLAICQSIVAAHHGSMTAANNPEGGATFCVSLPIRQPS